MLSARSSFLNHIEVNIKSQAGSHDALFTLDDKANIVTRHSFLDLQKKAMEVAQLLIDNELQGTRVVLLFPAGFDFIVSILACFYAKAIAVPLNIPHGKQMSRVSHVISDCTPSAVLTTPVVLNSFAINQEPSPFVMEKKCDLTTITYVPIKNKSVKCNESVNIALIQHTSGSTSQPKGVIITYDNMLYMVSYIQKTVGLTAKDKSLTWLPNYHDMGLFEGLLTPLYTGYSLHILSPSAFIKNPLIWMEAISRYRITHSGGPNFSYDLCADKLKNNPSVTLDLSTWRSAYNAAEPIRKESIDKFISAAKPHGFNPASLYCCYGLAEAVLMVTCQAGQPSNTLYVQPSSLRKNNIALVDSPTHHALVSSGRAQFDTTVIVVDLESLHELPANQVGEIWVSGPSVAKGYWNNSIASLESFHAYANHSTKGPFLRTGDLGFLNDDGDLFITGRCKDTLIIHGENYYPTDIELTAEACSPFSKIHDAAVFSLDADHDIVLVLRVKNAPEHYSFHSLAETIVKNVYEINNVILNHVMLTEQAIPKTSSGKIQRQLTRTHFINQEIIPIYSWTRPHTTPQKNDGLHTKIENQLVFWLANEMNIDVASIDKKSMLSVFGLDSIKMVDMLNSVEKITGLVIEQHIIQDYPSIETLAQYLSSSSFINGKKSTKNTISAKNNAPVGIVIPEFNFE